MTPQYLLLRDFRNFTFYTPFNVNYQNLVMLFTVLLLLLLLLLLLPEDGSSNFIIYNFTSFIKTYAFTI